MILTIGMIGEYLDELNYTDEIDKLINIVFQFGNH